MTFNFPLRLYNFGLRVYWTEYQENGYSLCLYPCCSLSNQHFGSSPETCCPNPVLTVPPEFSCSDGFACQRLFEWHTMAFVLPYRLLQETVFGSRSLWTGPNHCKSILFFFFLTRVKNVLIRWSGEETPESVSVFGFLLGPTTYFYLNWASSENLASTLVCSYFCLSH